MLTRTGQGKAHPNSCICLSNGVSIHYIAFHAHLWSDAILLAKKLKKAWVDKQKIKSKWKATKRKEGLGGKPLSSNDPSTRTELPDSDHKDASESENGAASLQQTLPQRTKATSSKSNDSKQVHDQPDLRELRRQAYAPESLHTHKADPLHRRRGDSSRGRGRGAPISRGRGGPAWSNDRISDRRDGSGSQGRGSITSSARGHVRHTVPDHGRVIRGQPNMRLRMNAMLEQIKRDIA